MDTHANTYLIGHALRRNAAGQFGPDLAKKLSQLVKMEKNVMRSMELVGRERMEVAVSCTTRRKISQLTFTSNNSQSGVNLAMRMYLMLRINLVFCFTRSVSSRINMLTVMTNTA
jgi:hypothetical protein